ncbi:hypothetical protein ATCC90586_010892 [Pythium insidiosum]|nr:hypothetical protein ATCC90586_010892 [Pythium insidiosum]
MTLRQVAIKALPKMRVLSLRKTIDSYRAQGPVWGQVMAFVSEQHLGVMTPCFSMYHDMGYKEKDVDVEFCVPVRDDVAVPAPFKIHELEAVAKTASIVHNGPYETLPETYNELYGWIAQNKATPCGPGREVYVKMEPADPSANVTEIYVPIA